MSVKFSVLLMFSFFLSACCFAQDSVAQRNRLSDSVLEHFFVLKSAPDTRVGRYTAFLKHRTLLAVGQYKNGKKSGLWQFFGANGRLSERYNYDKKMFTFEAPLYESGDLHYAFEDTLKPTDRLTRPLKIGGVYMGYVPYLHIFKLPFSTYDTDTDDFGAVVELLISPLGRLADYKVRVVSQFYQYDQIYSMDVGLFSEEDKTFIPATKNGMPVMSRIIIKCYVTGDGGLDFY